MYQFDWATGARYLVKHYSACLYDFVKVFLNEISIELNRLSKAD